MKKRFLASALVAIMLLQPISAIPVAAESNVISQNYVYEDYEVSYEVTNSWGNTEVVSVTVSNTGDDIIENWMLAYDDFSGEVTGIWDATVAQTDSGYEYMRNMGYNANILPNQSVSFGYTLSDSTGVPDIIIMSQDRLEKPSSGFSAELNVVNDWGTMFNGEIVLTNDTDKPMEWWELEFDTNFTITEITNSWAATVTELEPYSYMLKGTYTGIVGPNSSVTLGFQAIKNGDPEITNISLTEMVFSNPVERSEDNLVDIGEAYFKDIESLDEIDVDDNGIEFVKNQFLLTAYEDVSFAEIETFASTYDAEIVGYIELTNDYQLEIDYDVDADDIYQIIDESMRSAFVEFASLNTVIESDYASIPNDPWNPNETTTWDTDNPSGSNWGVEAIDALGAWEYIDQMYPVKVGVIDSTFVENHEDLNLFHAWNNPINTNASHGSHVAGTMAATFNNEVGISGIIPYNKLYAVSRVGSSEVVGEQSTAMEWKYLFSFLIGNDVKVINISQRDFFNNSDGDYNASILGEFLSKLIDMRYEFNIVAAAGNDGVTSDAKDISLLNRISIEEVKERIIVVGSIGRGNAFETTYHISSFSSRGERVDVVAPGGEYGETDIYSTVLNNKYAYNKGTSMAAPHVSGIAGLLYSVNPNLSGAQVKEIIVETSGGAGREFTDNLGGSYGIANAKLAVERALETEGENAPKNESIVFVCDYLSDARIRNATIRIQGTDAQNNDVDLYLTEGSPIDVTTGWYNITVMADGYVTYRYKFHSSRTFVKINLVEDIQNYTGYLQITAKDWINNQNADTEFDLYTIDENFNQIKQNQNGTYATTSGVTEAIELSPGYYLPMTTTGSSQYLQELYPVAANHTTNEICMKFGFSGDVQSYGFQVQVQGENSLGINFRLAARSSEESLRLDEAIIATNIHPVNYSGVYFHFFDTQQVRDNKEFSIGFRFTQAQINLLNEVSDDALGIEIMISHGLYGTPHSDPIWITASDLVSGWDAQTQFVEFATISFDNTAEDYTVNSDYWLLDS